MASMSGGSGTGRDSAAALARRRDDGGNVDAGGLERAAYIVDIAGFDAHMDAAGAPLADRIHPFHLTALVLGDAAALPVGKPARTGQGEMVRRFADTRQFDEGVEDIGGGENADERAVVEHGQRADLQGAQR